MKALWITWENQRRNRSMADQVQARLCELSYTGKSRVLRYLNLGIQTVRIIGREKPSVVFYQNPSIVLAALVAAWRKITAHRFQLVGDFHNAGVFPPVGRAVTRWVARNSDLVIVTNTQLQNEVNDWGAKSIAMPDPIPDLQGHVAARRDAAAPLQLLFICSWAEDEPIAEVFGAAQRLQQAGAAVTIRITGRPKLERFVANVAVPDNIALTGYLSDEDFERELHEADAILDLTTRDNCMVCGAYEGVAAEKPLILSGNAATRAYFNRGVLFTDNSADDIASQISALIERHEGLAADVKTLKQELLQRQQAALHLLQKQLDNAAGNAGQASLP